jgi:hypothetical protein
LKPGDQQTWRPTFGTILARSLTRQFAAVLIGAGPEHPRLSSRSVVVMAAAHYACRLPSPRAVDSLARKRSFQPGRWKNGQLSEAFRG